MKTLQSILRLVTLACIGCALVLCGQRDAQCQSFDLSEYLPYGPGVTSEFAPSSGFALSMNGLGLTEPVFYWLASNPDASLKTNFRVNESGLAVLSQEGTTAGEPNDTEDYDPDWIIAPKVVSAGQVVNSTGSFNGFETGYTWTGNTSGTLTVNGLESLTWLAGTTDVLKLTFVNSWSDSDANFGTSTQTWWMVRYVGVVKLRYEYEETDSEGGPGSGTFEFNLSSSSLVAAPQIVTQPVSLSVNVGDPATFTVEPGGAGPFTYQWRKGSSPIQDATDASYMIASAMFSDEGDYDVVVTNPYGSTPSSVATLTVEEVSDPATINDPNLEAALRLALAKPTGVLTITDLQGLTGFSALNQGITDLTGLEHAVNLKILNLSQNQISDLSALSTLTEMVNLTLNSNQIADVSPLAGMSVLKELYLAGNQIVDAGPLTPLTTLTRINLTGNLITDISPLAALTNLTQLDAGNNLFSDISSLTSLQKLVILQIPINKIEDISPLASMPNLIGINLQNNFITNLAPLQGRTGLTSFLIAANYLDLSPGSPDRLILDALITGGTTVVSAPQFAVPVTTMTSSPSLLGDTLHLEWNSQAGFTYQVLMSEDLVTWTPVEGMLVSGDGSTQSADVSLATEGNMFFQVDLGLD